MKKCLIIAMTLGLLGMLMFSGIGLAFDPQPEPPGIISKITQRESAGVTRIMFSELFPIKPDGGLMPFGSLIEKGFDPQPEPPGKYPDR